MAASKNKIREWLERGKKTGATHVIVVCDRWDYEDFPVYVDSNQSVRDKVSEYSGENMCSIMEVYNLSMDIEAQLNEYKAWNL